MTREEKAKQLTKKFEKEDRKKKTKSTAKTIFKIFLILFTLAFILFYYMRFMEPKMLRVKEVGITSPHLPSEFHGYKIAHISDIHYLMTTDQKDLKKIVNKINLLKPDILVLTGDLFDSSITYSEEDITNLKTELEKINVTTEKYYIKGNHDYKEDTDDILESIGFISLNNKSDIIYKSETSFIRIKGYGSSIRQDFTLNLDNDDTYTITLLHEADNADKITDSDLILAGHSHNLQINIPVIRTLFTVNGCKKYYNEHYTVNNTDLYISSGIGTSKYRLRLMNPPTINFYRLRTH